MNATNTVSSAAESTADELRELLREAEQALGNPDSESGELLDQLRERLRSAAAQGKHTFNRFRHEAQRQAKRADELVRTHPYQAIGIAVGVGALIGFLCARNRH